MSVSPLPQLHPRNPESLAFFQRKHTHSGNGKRLALETMAKETMTKETLTLESDRENTLALGK